MRANLLVLVLLVGLAGCASEAKTGTLACAPEGLTDLSGWTAHDFRPAQTTQTDDGGPVDLVSVVMSRGTESILLMFRDNDLIAVDPKPADKAVPILVNTRHFTTHNLIRRHPGGACEWRPLLTGDTT